MTEKERDDAREAIRHLLQDAALAALKANRAFADTATTAIAHGLSLDDVRFEVAAIHALMVPGTPPLALHASQAASGEA